MKVYIGTKVVKAEFMIDHEFAATVRHLPDVTPGQFRDGYKVVYEDGYVSWSPKDVFDRCYRLVTDAEKALLG